MILRATSDLHLTRRTARLVFAALQELRDDAAEHGGVTVIAGDVFDQPELVHMPTWNELRETLHRWPAEVYVLAGNHDQYDGARNCLEGLAGGSCVVISQPTVTPYGAMIPYVSPEKFPEAIQYVSAVVERATAPPLPLLWCHAGFRGTYRNAMSVDRDGLACSVIPEGWLAIAGHYHMPQTAGRIIYCGSPYETTFAEEGQMKGWLRWDDATADIVPRRIPFRFAAPRHRTIEWDPTAGDLQAPMDLRPSDKIRLVVPVTRDEMKAYTKQIKAAGLEGAPILAQPSVAGIRGVIDPRLGTQEAVSRYVRSVVGVDNTQPDPTAMDEWAEEVGLWTGNE